MIAEWGQGGRSVCTRSPGRNTAQCAVLRSGGPDVIRHSVPYYARAAPDVIRHTVPYYARAAPGVIRHTVPYYVRPGGRNLIYSGRINEQSGVMVLVTFDVFDDLGDF